VPVLVLALVLGGFAVVRASATGAEGLVFHPVAPCLVYDTVGVATPPARFSAGQSRVIPTLAASYATQGGVDGPCGLPAGYAGLQVNVVALNPGGTGTLKVWASGTAEPVSGYSSLVQFQADAPHRNVANATAVAVGADAARSLVVRAVAAPVDVQLVVLGYYTGGEVDSLSARVAQLEADLAALEAATPQVVSAAVNAAGTLRAGSPGVTVTVTGIARRDVDFGFDVSGCTYAVSGADAGSFVRPAAKPGVADVVVVEVTDGRGAGVTSDFGLVVHCP
jgi:hypothetical protein